ncbi:hypothetical protein H4R33_002510 [Dimargaris cristalligena]|nr:hypothetical protein H4R33_002510 [Dimargaris cristalligena]
MASESPIDLDSLETLNRSELQQLCKELGIKFGRRKNRDIIDTIRKSINEDTHHHSLEFESPTRYPRRSSMLVAAHLSSQPSPLSSSAHYSPSLRSAVSAGRSEVTDPETPKIAQVIARPGSARPLDFPPSSVPSASPGRHASSPSVSPPRILISSPTGSESESSRQEPVNRRTNPISTTTTTTATNTNTNTNTAIATDSASPTLPHSLLWEEFQASKSILNASANYIHPEDVYEGTGDYDPADDAIPWLIQNGFLHCVRVLRHENLYSFTGLKLVTFEMLRDIGFTLGTALRLLRALKELFPGEVQGAPSGINFTNLNLIDSLVDYRLNELLDGPTGEYPPFNPSPAFPMYSYNQPQKPVPITEGLVNRNKRIWEHATEDHTPNEATVQPVVPIEDRWSPLETEVQAETVHSLPNGGTAVLESSRSDQTDVPTRVFETTGPNSHYNNGTSRIRATATVGTTRRDLDIEPAPTVKQAISTHSESEDDRDPSPDPDPDPYPEPEPVYGTVQPTINTTSATQNAQIGELHSPPAKRARPNPPAFLEQLEHQVEVPATPSFRSIKQRSRTQRSVHRLTQLFDSIASTSSPMFTFSPSVTHTLTPLGRTLATPLGYHRPPYRRLWPGNSTIRAERVRLPESVPSLRTAATTTTATLAPVPAATTATTTIAIPDTPRSRTSRKRSHSRTHTRYPPYQTPTSKFRPLMARSQSSEIMTQQSTVPETPSLHVPAGTPAELVFNGSGRPRPDIPPTFTLPSVPVSANATPVQQPPPPPPHTTTAAIAPDSGESSVRDWKKFLQPRRSMGASNSGA